jgi:indolepyruvate ferredoxin oxidoreductase beta subunit
MEKRTVDIIVAGVGGQGLVLLTDMLSEAAHLAGYEVKSNDVIGLSQRGGKVWGSVRFGETIHSPNIRKGTADFILALEPLEGLRWQSYLKPQGRMIINTSEVYPVFAIAEKAPYPHDFLSLVRPDVVCESYDVLSLSLKAGTVKVSNVLMMGLLAKHLNIPVEIWKKIIATSVPSKFLNENYSAFDLGLNQ